MAAEMRKAGLDMSPNDYLLQQMLVWLQNTKKPLTLWQLQHAVSIRPRSVAMNENDIPSPGLMQAVTAGLITLDESTGEICMHNKKSKRYLTRKLGHWLVNADTEIARACITYMRFTPFEYGPSQSDQEFEARMQANPLYEYAAYYWGHHVREATRKAERAILYHSDIVSTSPANLSPVLLDLSRFCFEEFNILQREVIDFLHGGPYLLAASQAIQAIGTYRARQSAHSYVMVDDSPVFADYSQNIPQGMTGMHVAAWFGLTPFIPSLIKTGQDPNAETSNGRTPLSLAAGNGHQDTVITLINRYEADPRSRSFHGLAPINFAAFGGHGDVVQELLDSYRVDVESPCMTGQTALSDAALNGHDKVVHILLDRGANVNSTERIGKQTPLILAVLGCHEDVVQSLIHAGADVGIIDTSGLTALGHAAELGFTKIAKILYERVSGRSYQLYGRRRLSYFGRCTMRGVAELKASP